MLGQANFLLAIVGCRDFPGGAVVENLTVSAGDARDVSSVPGSGRSPGVGNDNLL